MNEKDLNIEYICKKTLLSKGDELVPIILDLIQESYKAGLCQAEFDNTMNLIEETQELKKKYVNAVADYVHKDTLTATDYVELNKDNELLMSYNQALIKENQELKLELSGYRQAILNNKEMLGLKEQNKRLKQKYENAVSDYETTMFEKEQLKKQVENYKKLGFKYLQDKNNNLETQQKEFIKYLQEELNVQIQEESIGCEITNKRYILEEILQKYKEIIGVSDENNIK